MPSAQDAFSSNFSPRIHHIDLGIVNHMSTTNIAPLLKVWCNFSVPYVGVIEPIHPEGRTVSRTILLTKFLETSRPDPRLNLRLLKNVRLIEPPAVPTLTSIQWPVSPLYCIVSLRRSVSFRVSCSCSTCLGRDGKTQRDII